jgi:diguanylate cyclase (GGDEF)-like protein
MSTTGWEETLFGNARTRVSRITAPDGSQLIRKEALGPNGLARALQEAAIMERLAGLDGVPQLAGPPVGPALSIRAIPARPLAELISAAAPGPALDLAGLLDLAAALATLLAQVHRRGVIHRNINAINILVRLADGAPVLTDFELATTFVEERPSFAHTTAIAGTLAYLAPEQTGRTGQGVDHRADLYSLGILLYELGTGHTPFGRGEKDPLGLIHDHLATLPVPPRQSNPTLFQPLSDVIMKLLQKEPDRRYQSAEGLAHDLRQIREAPTGAAFRPGLRDFPLRLAAPSRLIHREAEISVLTAAVGRAAAGQTGGVLITGPKGVGKTALIDRLRPIVTAAGGWFITGTFDQRDQERREDAVAQAVRGLGRLLLAEPEAELADYRTRLLAALGDRAGLLASIIPEFGLLLGVAAETGAGTDADPEETGRRLYQAGLAALQVAASADRPVVMAVDDLQRASAFPLGMIDILLTDPSVSGLLVVCAYRDDEIDAGHPVAELTGRWERQQMLPPMLRLGSLPPAGLAEMLTEMLRLEAEPAARLSDVVGARTGGNPGRTVALLNALRTEGALTLAEDGWSWDGAAIQRHIGEGDSDRRLADRFGRLPEPTSTVLAVLACLSGPVDLELLATSAELPPDGLNQRLTPALEDGLLVLSQGELRFAHPRVQQMIESGLQPATRSALQLTVARRLAAAAARSPATARYETAAAALYLTIPDALTDPEERRQASRLCHRVVEQYRPRDPARAEQLLAAAATLLTGLDTQPDQRELLTLDVERHALLTGLGRPADADQLYRSIEPRCLDPMDLVDAACAQIVSLINQGRAVEAVELGLELLGRLGLVKPAEPQLSADNRRGAERLQRWIEDDDQAGDEARPEASNPVGQAQAEIIRRMAQAAFITDRTVLSWLMVQSHQLWTEHGPGRALVGALSHAGLLAIDDRQDYRSSYLLLKRILATSEKRGYEPETSSVRFLFTLTFGAWFEPLEDCLTETRRAREGLLQGGDQHVALFTYFPALALSLDCEPTLESTQAVLESGAALRSQAGSQTADTVFGSYQSLIQTLRGEVLELSQEPTGNPFGDIFLHLNQGLAAAILNDGPALARHAAAAMPLLALVEPDYVIYRGHLLQGLALADAARTAEPEQRPALLGEFDACRDWLAARASDAPNTFGPLVALLDAEKAYAVDDFRKAVLMYDRALQQNGQRRPWQQALITERTTAFYWAQGLHEATRILATGARDSYAAWGATAKVEQLQRQYPFLPPYYEAEGQTTRSGNSMLRVSSDAVDLLAVLKASQALSSETEMDRLQARVAEVLSEMTGATHVTVVLRNEDDREWVLPGAHDVQNEETADPLGVEDAGSAGLLPLSAFRYAERTREPLLVADATKDNRFSTDPYLASARCCSLMVIPILSQGLPRVMLVLENRLHANVFSPERLDAILLIAGQLAVSFDNARARSQREQEADRRLRLLDTLQRRERLLETLLAIQRDISHRAPLPKVLDGVTSGASTMLDDAFVALVLLDPLGDGRPRIPSVWGRPPGAADPGQDDAVLELARQAIEADQGVTEPGLIAAPVHASGEVIGSLVAGGNDQPGHEGERLDLLSAFAEQVSLALNDANTLEAIREASYDSLTGLASRPLFLDRLKRALQTGAAEGAEVSVLFIDLDRFKAVNDSLGHGAGDDLLAEVALRLRSCIREKDTGARLGGDEFAVLLEQTRGDAAGLGAAERIRDALQAPFRIAGQDLFVTASIGVAHGSAADLSADDLLEQADLAMYRAKKAGARRAMVFEPQMHAEARARLELQGDLQRALANSEFHLQFQPLIALGQDRPIGIEALARWRHPQRGPISPAAFIPVAEETGLIVELGHWVLVESCRQLAAWRAEVLPDLELSLNVSGRQLLDGQLALDVAAILAETGLPARALTLELTETVLMDDPGNILLRLSELKELGVQLAIDDFGTGYSSLSYLRRFPVDKLKIDKSFIDNIETVEEDLAIVRTVVDLARILQLQTTAEGIETPQQRDLLTAAGCEVGQGYLFARPLDAEALPGFLGGYSVPASAAGPAVSPAVSPVPAPRR